MNKFLIYYLYPPKGGEPIAMIVPEEEAVKHKGQFQKTYRRFEAHNWNIVKIKQKVNINDKKEIHPQTGKQLG
tara:strand:- start:1307 stop:1525 length:219 start_codon:yes stop_codon:yes gene_type:complete